MGKPTENQQSSLLYSLLWKKITNKQKTWSYFWMQLCIWKDFKWSLFLSFSQSMTNSQSANLYFNNTVQTSLTLSALSKAAAHRYSWLHRDKLTKKYELIANSQTKSYYFYSPKGRIAFIFFSLSIDLPVWNQIKRYNYSLLSLWVKYMHFCSQSFLSSRAMT